MNRYYEAWLSVTFKPYIEQKKKYCQLCVYLCLCNWMNNMINVLLVNIQSNPSISRAWLFKVNWKSLRPIVHYRQQRVTVTLWFVFFFLKTSSWIGCVCNKCGCVNALLWTVKVKKIMAYRSNTLFNRLSDRSTKGILVYARILVHLEWVHIFWQLTFV